MSNRLSASVASAIATLTLLLGTTLASAQQFGTAEEAKAMLDRAVAALKSDEAKALAEFSDPNNKQFHDRDLYVSCFRISDGKFTAFPGPGMIGVDVRTFNLGDDPIGQRAFDAVQGLADWRPGDPVFPCCRDTSRNRFCKRGSLNVRFAPKANELLRRRETHVWTAPAVQEESDV